MNIVPKKSATFVEFGKRGGKFIEQLFKIWNQ